MCTCCFYKSGSESQQISIWEKVNIQAYNFFVKVILAVILFLKICVILQ